MIIDSNDVIHVHHDLPCRWKIRLVYDELYIESNIFFYDENYFSFPMESLLGNVGQKKYAYKISMPYLLVHFS